MRPRAFSPSSAVTSRPTVSSPASTASCAMPAPIVPSPTTPTFTRRAYRATRGAADDPGGRQRLDTTVGLHKARERCVEKPLELRPHRRALVAGEAQRFRGGAEREVHLHRAVEACAELEHRVVAPECDVAKSGARELPRQGVRVGHRERPRARSAARPSRTRRDPAAAASRLPRRRASTGCRSSAARRRRRSGAPVAHRGADDSGGPGRGCRRTSSRSGRRRSRTPRRTSSAGRRAPRSARSRLRPLPPRCAPAR